MRIYKSPDEAQMACFIQDRPLQGRFSVGGDIACWPCGCLLMRTESISQSQIVSRQCHGHHDEGLYLIYPLSRHR
ncbi:MAG: hypothetical protein GY757_18955 [bacterium]|nr:hypothetical protein [bacterium]